MTLGLARSFIPYAKNAWQFTLDAVTRYYERIFASAAQGESPELPPAFGPLKLLQRGAQPENPDHVGSYLESARLLGVRLAELHLALATGRGNSEFVMEPITSHYLRGVFQTMRSDTVQNLRQLRRQLKTLPVDLQPVAQHVADLEPAILNYYRPLVDQSFEAGRIRIQGDCQLDQILWTGKDFVFANFEGDVSLPISERRLKRSPLTDVARMARSFHHAAYVGIHQQVELGTILRENLPKYEPWIRHWTRAVSRAFIAAYCDRTRQSALLPDNEEKLRTLIVAYALHELVDELGRELRARSENIRASLQFITLLTDELMPVRAGATAATIAEPKPEMEMEKEKPKP
jgi:maltose alpha-D-glucosyltransferase/alpha-amylase